MNQKKMRLVLEELRLKGEEIKKKVSPEIWDLEMRAANVKIDKLVVGGTCKTRVEAVIEILHGQFSELTNLEMVMLAFATTEQDFIDFQNWCDSI